MAHTPLFSRLRRLGARVMWAHRRGLRTPDELAAAVSEATPVSRRGLGRVAVGLVGGYASSGCSSEADDDPSGDARVVIVGGGLAGMHCAYRLAEAGVKAVVHDAWDRVGGRTFSTSEGAPAGMVLELGGELIDSNHATMWTLADELGLTLDDRFTAAPPGESFFVAGASVDEATVLSQWMAVAPSMAMMVDAADNDDAAYDQYDNQSLRDWLDQNVPSATYPELHVILDVAYRGEFGLENDEQSALNLLYLMDPETTDEFLIFGDSDERYHTHGGNDQFVARMAATLEPDQIVLASKLIAARDGETEGTFVLTFEDANGGTVEVEADHVVFALPFTTLRECDLADLTLTATKRQIIEELGYGTNAKVMGSFTSPGRGATTTTRAGP